MIIESVSCGREKPNTRTITCDVGLLKPRENDDPDDAHYDYARFIVSFHPR